MGFLLDLFGKSNNAPQAPSLVSIIPPNVAAAIRAGKLPTFKTRTVLLGENEICRFIDRAALVTQKVTKRYRHQANGTSFKVMKGITLRTGGGTSTPIEEKVTEYTQGFIYVTDLRIIFVAQEKGFEKKIKNLTAVVPYSNGVGLQYGNQTYNLLTPQPDLLVQVIHRIA